jgi:hypothetical protein
MDHVATIIDTHAVTKFVEPTEITTMKADFHSVEKIPESEVASIADFLARPVLQHNTFWETTDAAGHELIPLGVGLPSDGFLRTNTMFADKLKGYNLVKATVNYRIQINSNPFQQGKLLAHFLPFHVEAGASYVKMRNFNLATKTQQPSVDVDCRCGGAEMSIPYLAPTTHYELSDGLNPSYERGRLHLSVLSPLKTGSTGTQDVEVAVWIYFTDVELRAPLVPQSSDGRARRKRSAFKGNVIGPFKKEREVMMESKIVSKGLETGSKIASTLSAIPILADFMGPASWVMGTMSGIASSFGYARPDVSTVPTPVTMVYDKYMATGDGADVALPLAVTTSNSLSMGSYGYCGEDEMSLNYLLKKEALIGSFDIGTASVHNSVLYKLTLEPSGLYTGTNQTNDTNTQVVRTGPPIAYLSSKFLFWRGAIKIRFSLVKTAMQSGRIQVSFTPRCATTVTEPSVTTGSYSMREIIDITTDDDMIFELPYMMPTMYLEVGQPMGTLEVRVLNQLRSPEAAASTIQVLVYASAGEDFEFAVPSNIKQNVLPLLPQMDESLDTVTEPTLSAAEACVGERLLSVRQLLRFTSLKRPAVVTGNWYPWGFGYCTLTSDTTNPLTIPTCVNDMYSFIGLMYCLHRGGIDVAAVTTTPDRSQAGATLSFRTANGAEYMAVKTSDDLVGSSTASNFEALGVNFVTSETAATMVVAVPYYNRFPVSLVVPSNVVSSEKSRPRVSVQQTVSGSNMFIARRIREDFQLSLFVGCPPYTVITTA